MLVSHIASRYLEPHVANRRSEYLTLTGGNIKAFKAQITPSQPAGSTILGMDTAEFDGVPPPTKEEDGRTTRTGCQRASARVVPV